MTKESVKIDSRRRSLGRVSACRPRPRRLLLVFAGGLGDLIMSLPLISRASRQSETWLLVHEGYDLWLPLLDYDVRICRPGEELPQFDGVVMLHSTPGAPPRRAPVVAISGREWPFLTHASQADLESGDLVGLERETRKDFSPSIRTGKSPVPPGTIVFCPDMTCLPGQWRKKSMPFQIWNSLAIQLKRRGFTLTAVDQYPAPLAVDFAYYGVLEPLQLSALLLKARAVVTIDCGVAHLAAALGRPTIVAWGPTSLLWSRPQGPLVWIVKRPNCHCSECLGTTTWDLCSRPLCMSIPTASLLEAVEEACVEVQA